MLDKMSQRPLCIYHGNCADGFGAALVVYNHYSGDCDFIAGVYQQQPPNCAGRDVIIVDFSYKRAVMQQILDQCKSLLVLDHHKSAAEDLSGFGGADCIEETRCHIHFDMTKSGAMLAWNHFNPEAEAPDLIKHIQDRDLWQFKLQGTREIQANLFSFPYDFSVWNDLLLQPVAELVEDGIAIERKHFKDVGELLAVCTRRMIIAGHNVEVANMPYTLSSDAGHALALKSKTFGWGACYWDTPRGRVFSLRSTDWGIDVSEIAKKYGGGGHNNAAGFTVDYVTALTFEVSKEEGGIL